MFIFMQVLNKRSVFLLMLKYMAFSIGNRNIRNACQNARQTQVDYFYECRNGVLLALCTYSRSPHTHLQQHRHYSVQSHSQNFTSPLLVRRPSHIAHCRTGSFSLGISLYHCQPAGVGGVGATESAETDWTSVQTIEISRLDSWEGQVILLFSKMPRPTLGPTHFPIYGIPGPFPQGQSDHDSKLTTHLHIVLTFRKGGCSSTPLMCRHVTVPTSRFGIFHVSSLQLHKSFTERTHTLPLHKIRVATASETTIRQVNASHRSYKQGHLIHNKNFRACNTGKVSMRKDVESTNGKA